MAKSVNVGPTVDGVAEGLWAEVPEVSVSTAVGANAGTHQVTIKSVYTSSDIYFLVQWDDPTHSLRRFPWQKQEDGTWMHLNDGSDHDEIEFYEDKFVFIWDIGGSINGFGDAGCMVTCHTGEAPKPYGNKYTMTLASGATSGIGSRSVPVPSDTSMTNGSMTRGGRRMPQVPVATLIRETTVAT